MLARNQEVSVKRPSPQIDLFDGNADADAGMGDG
jgi:hypothetical protein